MLSCPVGRIYRNEHDEKLYRIRPSRDEHTFEGFVAYNSPKL
jgi:hypothetical protein